MYTKKHQFSFWFFLPVFLLGIIFGYLYSKRYVPCLTKDVLLCIKSDTYKSSAGRFNFRYPHDYPISFKTGSELSVEYAFDDTYVEWVTFTGKFYPNAGGDTLGSLIVKKNTSHQNLNEYVKKEVSGFKNPPEITSTTIGGEDAACIALSRQPNSFAGASYNCYVVHEDNLYRFEFDYNERLHTLPAQYYVHAREIILATFSFH